MHPNLCYYLITLIPATSGWLKDALDGSDGEFFMGQMMPACRPPQNAFSWSPVFQEQYWRGDPYGQEKQESCVPEVEIVPIQTHSVGSPNLVLTYTFLFLLFDAFVFLLSISSSDQGCFSAQTTKWFLWDNNKKPVGLSLYRASIFRTSFQVPGTSTKVQIGLPTLGSKIPGDWG